MDPDNSDETDNFDEFYNIGAPGQRNTKLEKFDQNVRKFHGDLELNDYEYRTGAQQQPSNSEQAKLNRVSYNFGHNSLRFTQC